MEFSELKGLTCSQVFQTDNDEIHFKIQDGRHFKLHHEQDCCETVAIEDITGNLADLIGSPLLQAEENSNSDNPKPEDAEESHTWTFYRLATEKGSVVIRFYGSSNSYYSESAELKEIIK